MGAPDAEERVASVVEAGSADLLAYFVRRVDSPEDAADLLGETLLVIWRRAEAIPADDVGARMWMFGIARNVLSTHGRTARRRSALQDRLRSELRTSPDPTGAGDPLDVPAALRHLDERDQEIIRLTYWDGFTQKQAAELLGMPEGTVRSRHHRARATLRELLTEARSPSRG